jgi:adenine phosphoribosyltransferase
MELTSYIRDVPDFPKKGIIFKDITTLLQDGAAFKKAVDLIFDKYRDKGIGKVVGMESRGFIFGAPLAYLLGCGFAPVRKPGKLPYEKISEDYELEYGTDSLEMHVDAISPGEKVLIVDDLLATGGTAAAVIRLVETLKGDIAGVEFLIELQFLNGREKLKKYPICSHLKY